jgi:hypothetical protein
VVKEKDVELKDVVDKHDTAVREKFHLERYISIFEGWDPKVSPDFRRHASEGFNADLKRTPNQTTRTFS